MKKQKKMHFFRLDMYTLGKDKDGNSVQQFPSIKEKQSYLQEIIDNRLNSNRTIKINKDINNPESPSAIFEVITDNEFYVFGKLGREHDINQFQKRKNDTLEASPIFKGDDELFESFSYVLIHKGTFAVSYIKEATAPSIMFLGYLITNLLKEESKIWGLIESLVDEDAIPILSGKDIIGRISYEITLPDGYTNLISGLTDKEYDQLQNQKGTKVTVELKAKKRKESVFKDEKDAEGFFKSVKNKFKNIKVSAKDDGEDYMQDFKLVDNPFTKKVNFNYNISKDTGVDLQKQIENQMWLKYQQNQDSISNYIGFKN